MEIEKPKLILSNSRDFWGNVDKVFRLEHGKLIKEENIETNNLQNFLNLQKE